MIYVDNAATGFYKPAALAQRLTEYLSCPGNPGRGSSSAAMNAARMVLDTRMKLADFFGCSFTHVAFTGGVTESLNTAISGLLDARDHVVTTYLEHNSVLRPLYRLGCAMTVCAPSTEAIGAAITDRTRAVIVNHVSNVTGEIQDIRAIGQICRDRGVLLIVDAAQSAGVLPISMQEELIDVLCFTGHKGMLGLQGIGGLCVREGVDIRPLKVGGSGVRSFDHEHPARYPERLEAGTLNVPGILSLNVSLDELNARGTPSIWAHERALAQRLCERLRAHDRIRIYREAGKSYTGVVSVNIEGMDAGRVSDRLSREYGIETRAGAHCAPLAHEHYGTQSMVRFSFGLNNAREDADACASALLTMAEEGL